MSSKIVALDFLILELGMTLISTFLPVPTSHVRTMVLMLYQEFQPIGSILIMRMV